MSASMPLVQDHYNRHVGDEERRLDLGKLEYRVTFHIIRELINILQKSSSDIKIADIGCGTGRYAIPLASEGHEVSIADISAAEIDFAKQKAAARGVSFQYSVAIDARSIRSCPELFRKSYYDLELWLGPFYHLLDRNDQIEAMLAALNMARPGGFIAVAFVMRNAHLRDMATKDPNRIKSEWDFYRQYMIDGRYTRGSNAPMHHTTLKEIDKLLDEVKAVAKRSGLDFEVFKKVSCEGFLGFHHACHLASLEEDSFAKWMEVILPTAADEANTGSADHLLVIVQRGA